MIATQLVKWVLNNNEDMIGNIVEESEQVLDC